MTAYQRTASEPELCAELACIHSALHAPLARFVGARVADPVAAEDLVQDVYLRLHAHADQLRSVRNLRGWVYQVARHAIIDYYRRRRITLELPETLALPPDPCEDDVLCELAPGVADMVASLPDRYSQALHLVELQGLTQSAAAARLGISLSGMKSRVQRGREMLRQRLLACCHFELDRHGRVISFHERCCCCCSAAAATTDS